MIKAILGAIIRFLFFVIYQLFNLTLVFFPQIQNVNALTDTFAVFFSYCNQALNLLYFVSGDLIFTFIDIWATLWLFKHIILPVINFTRKAIMDLF